MCGVGGVGGDGVCVCGSGVCAFAKGVVQVPWALVYGKYVGGKA